MWKTLVLAALATTLVGPSTVLAAPGVKGGGSGSPLTEKSSRYAYQLAPDDLYLAVCGIRTTTTVTETDILKTWPDGSQSFHVERSYVPADPRLPIERGAGTAYFAPDGTQTAIVGKPIQLIWPHGGVRTLDAGLTLLGGSNVIHHGHLDFGLDPADLAPFYCP